MTDWTNKLYFGDNLSIMREQIADESVDLVYLDPPFNSKASYNVLFREKDGSDSTAQITAFDDTWHWDIASEETFRELVTEGPPRLAELMCALRSFLGQNDMMAYLTMMAARLVEMHRVLKPTGSIYLHCDPTASHYLKLVMDAVFGPQNFCNHIIWKRSDTHNDARKQYSSISDHILFYRKCDIQVFHKQHKPHAGKTLKEWYQYLEFPDGSVRRMTKEERETQEIPQGVRRFNTDNMTSPNPRSNLMYEYKGYPYPTKGWRYSRDKMEDLDRQERLFFPSKLNGRIMLKRYLDEQKGVTIGDVWSDIDQLRATMSERLGYPTQKPEALLERIIQASSNEGDVVFDPFCGCGTTVNVAERLKRRWIGIDITHLAITLMRHRLVDTFGPDLSPFEIKGVQTDVPGARALAEQNRHQFEWWAVGLVHARPAQDRKKGADHGIDGVHYFIPEEGGDPEKIVVQVKSGKVQVKEIRDLVGVVEREKAAIGAFITLEKPTKPMIEEAAAAGFYEFKHIISGNTVHFPKIQILTIEELLNGGELKYPAWAVDTTHRRAKRKRKKSDNQMKLL